MNPGISRPANSPAAGSTRASPAAVSATASPAAGSSQAPPSVHGDDTLEELLYSGNGNSDEEDAGVEDEEGDNYHTARASAHAVKVFGDFTRKTGLGIDADAFASSTELAAALEAFYVSGLTRRDGEPYKPNSVFLFRGGLKRYYATRLGVDIVHDLEFRAANDAFFARLKEIRLQGKGAVNHIPAITPDDLDRLYRRSVFDDADPKRLQWKVYFDIMIYLYERGNNMHGMDKFSLVLTSDSLGRRYLRYSCTPGEQEKRMYELPGDPLCPVLSYGKYLSRLHPDCDFLWQRPRKTSALAAAAVRSLPPPLCAWYDPHPIGFTSLKGFMALISQAAGLSRIYSATSILATSSAQLYHQRAVLLEDGACACDDESDGSPGHQQPQQHQPRPHEDAARLPPPASLGAATAAVKRERDWMPDDTSPQPSAAASAKRPRAVGHPPRDELAGTWSDNPSPAGMRYAEAGAAGKSSDSSSARNDDASRSVRTGVTVAARNDESIAPRSADPARGGTSLSARGSESSAGGVKADIACQVRGYGGAQGGSSNPKNEGRTPPPAVTTSSDDVSAVATSPRELLEHFVRGGQLFCCHHCDMYFAERSDYFLHRGLHLSESSPWQCSVCQRAFDGKNEFSLHIVNHIHRP